MPPNQDKYHLELPASLEALAPLAQFIQHTARQWGLPPEVQHALELTADEAVTNVASYAYPPGQEGTVRLELAREGDWVTLTIEDEGQPFQPESTGPPDLESDLQDRRIGGLGLYLMEKMMDRVERTRDQGINRLVLQKRLRPASAA